MALILYFGAALTVDPAEVGIRSSPSVPLELDIARREHTVDFVRPPVEPRDLATPDAQVAFEREPEAETDETVAPRIAPAERAAPTFDPPRRSPAGLLKRPVPPTSVTEAPQPSVESETLPVQVLNPPPEYPLSARRRRIEGFVVVEVVVLEDGRAGEARIVDGDPDSVFAGSALRAVRDWTFQPATRGGRPVRSVERIRFEFKLAGR